MTLPSFSLITVSYNQGQFIRDTIESVLAQNYPNFEHIVVDGGSTDQTISILKEYPHLKWTSEPDRGQTHALNKGFERATGDVVAWINSDDWYAPGTLAAVAEHIQEYPVVMGGCIVTDKEGNPKEEIHNLERTWFDTLKYWVYHSVPTQPGIFFRRDLMEALKAEHGSYLDEELFFTMDYELWLRMQERYPLSKRVGKNFAYVRVYDTNKTGADMAGAYREMSRVYRRHSARKVRQEQLFSFVLPVEVALQDAERIVQSISRQSVKQVEVLFVDRSKDRGARRGVQKQVGELGARFQGVACRYLPLQCSDFSLSAAIDFGISRAASQFAAYLNPHRELPQDFVARALQCFSRDNTGLLLPSLSDEQKSALFTPAGQGFLFNPVGPFRANLNDAEFVARTVAWLDCRQAGEASKLSTVDAEFLWKRLLLRMAHNAWQISADGLLSPAESTVAHEGEPFRLYTNSLVIDEIARDLKQNIFTTLRAKNGFALSVPDELTALAESILVRLPYEFAGTSGCETADELRSIVMRYPDFGPARFLLARLLEEGGRGEEAKQQLAIWRTIHESERASPLFGI